MKPKPSPSLLPPAKLDLMMMKIPPTTTNLNSSQSNIQILIIIYLCSDNPYGGDTYQPQPSNPRSNLYNEEPVEIAQSNEEEYTPQVYPSYEEPKKEKKQVVQEDSKYDTSNAEEDNKAHNLLSDMKKMKVEDVSQLEDASGDLDEDPKLKQFTVKNPVKITGHIKYTVTGVDSEGPFEDQRRYKEFFALRNTLAQRWPGIYIPPIPEKKLVGNNDDEFVEERRSLLERFMKECGKYEYVTHSKEFKLFAREKGDIEKMLSALGKLTPMQILEKYRLNFNIDEDQEGSPVSHYKENIIDFQSFLRKALPVMEIQKRQLKKMMTVRDE